MHAPHDADAVGGGPKSFLGSWVGDLGALNPQQVTGSLEVVLHPVDQLTEKQVPFFQDLIGLIAGGLEPAGSQTHDLNDAAHGESRHEKQHQRYGIAGGPEDELVVRLHEQEDREKATQEGGVKTGAVLQHQGANNDHGKVQQVWIARQEVRQQEADSGHGPDQKGGQSVSSWEREPEGEEFGDEGFHALITKSLGLVSPISSSVGLLVASDMPTTPTARARARCNQGSLYARYFP